MATQGLFNLLGPTPEEARSQYEAGLYLTPAQMGQQNLLQQVTSTIAGGGAGLGYGLGRMMGGAAPGEAEAIAQQEVLRQAQQSGLSGSALYKRLAETTADPRRALAFGQMADQAAAAEAKAAQDAQDAALKRRKTLAEVKELEGKPAREAAAAAAANEQRNQMLLNIGMSDKDASVFSKSSEISNAIIKDALKPTEGVKLTSEQALAAKAAGLPVLKSIDSYTPAQASEIRKIVLADKQKVADAASTKQVSAYASEVGKITATQDIELISGANKAPATVRKLRKTIDLLNKSDDELTTGIGAELINALNKARAKFLKDEKAGKNVENTEYLRALLGSDVFPLIGALGIGARGLDTPAERDFLLDVMAGRIGLDKGTLIRMTNDRLRAAEEGVSDFNSRLDAGDFNQYQEVTKRKLNKIILPEWTPPVPKEKTPQPATTSGWSIKKKG